MNADFFEDDQDVPLRNRGGRIFVRVLLCLAIGSIAMAGTAAGQVVDASHISFETIFAVGAMAFPLVWNMSKMLQKMSDRIDVVEKTMSNLPCERDPNRRGCGDKPG
jgi:hypothetical protein